MNDNADVTGIAVGLIVISLLCIWLGFMYPGPLRLNNMGNLSAPSVSTLETTDVMPQYPVLKQEMRQLNIQTISCWIGSDNRGKCRIVGNNNEHVVDSPFGQARMYISISSSTDKMIVNHRNIQNVYDLENRLCAFIKQVLNSELNNNDDIPPIDERQIDERRRRNNIY